MSAQLKKVLVASAIGVAVLASIVILAQIIRSSPAGQSFIESYPGFVAPLDATPEGFPAWLGWQHFLNAFFLLLVIRTGWIIRSKVRPPAFWTRKDNVVLALTGAKKRMGIYHWFHLCLDFLWVLNGIIFIVLLFVTGQWLRIVPTSWEVIPNAVSAGLQYASFNWPPEYSWTNYNSLQVLSYFVTVFIAAPIAIKTGLRLSPVWPLQGWLARAFPEGLAKRWHAGVMFYFLGFIVVHVTLVFTTGVLANLNAMYAGQDSASWLGFGIFALSLVVMIVAWFLVKPGILKPIARLSGKVQG
jgi:thiosulfate reductase cytochrome b subunit